MKIREAGVDYRLFGLFILIFPTGFAHAESGSVAYQSAMSMARGINEDQARCDSVKQNPTCRDLPAATKSMINIRLASCEANLKASNCAKFFEEFPEYASHKMVCRPYEVCRLGLQSTAAEGCKRYGIEVTDEFVSKFKKALRCTEDSSCRDGKLMSALHELGALFTHNPITELGELETNIAREIINGAKNDIATFKNISCLDPETQSEFTCKVFVKYGGMAAGIGGAGKAILAIREASIAKRVGVLEAAANARKARLNSAFEKSKTIMRATADVDTARLSPNLKKLYDVVSADRGATLTPNFLTIKDGKAFVKIGWIDRGNKSLMGAVMNAVKSGEVAEIDAGRIVGPQVLAMLVKAKDYAPAGGNLVIKGHFSPLGVLNSELVNKLSPSGYSEFQKSMKTMKVGAACMATQGARSLDDCGAMNFVYNSSNPDHFQWTRQDVVPDVLSWAD